MNQNKLTWAGVHLLNDLFDYPDIKLYRTSFSPLFSASWMLDRTELTTIPFNTEILKDNKLHYFDNYNIDLIESISHSANDLINEGKKIFIMWSGGIDSTLMVIAFLLNNVPNDQVIIVCNNDSIRENFKFYSEHIRKKFSLMSTELLIQQAKNQIMNGIILQADHADLIFSSSLGKIMESLFGEKYLNLKLTKENLFPFLEKQKYDEQSKHCFYELVLETSKKSPIEIKTIRGFAWWYSFNFRWQHNREKFKARINPNNDYRTFFSHKEIQKWSVKNLMNRIDLDDKTEFRKIIKDFTGDIEYSQYKIKWPSVTKHLATNSAHALTNNKALYNLNLLDFYNPNNFFSDWISQS
jgi:hypothetical protein